MFRPLQIYYNNQTGVLIQGIDGDEISDNCHVTTEEEALQCYPSLSGEYIEKIIVPYEQIDFTKKGIYYYHIDVDTKTIVWDGLIPIETPPEG